MIKKANTIFLLLIYLLCVRGANSQSNPFEISLSLSKSKYFEGEKIFLSVIYKNTRSKTDSIPEEMLFKTPDNLQLISASGEIAEQFKVDRSWVSKTYEVLKPSEKTVLKYNLGDFFYYAKSEDFPFMGEYFFSVGKYTVTFDKASAEFYVLHPHGLEEEALVKMTEARSIVAANINNKGYDTATVSKKSDLFYDIYTTYPESVYAEDAFVGYFNNYVLIHEIDSSTFAIANDFIERFPSSEKLEYILLKMSKSLYKRSDDATVVKYLNRIAIRYQGIKAGIYANVLLISENYKK